MKVWRVLAALGLAALCSRVALAGNGTIVTTLAGSGATGFADGSARSASFMLPMGVAYDASGNLYVADAAAQRIRKISRDGNVSTLAGSGAADASGVWVPGGYADGDGANARFNRPAAVAVGTDGRVYVADTYNHCIRVITPAGNVSTFAGSPARSGQNTGSHDVASFVMPLGLALDRAQNLYVVDGVIAGALRRIAPDGSVSEVKLPGVHPAGGIALVEGRGGLTFVLSDLAGLYVSRPDGTFSMFRSDFFRTKCAARTAPNYVMCDEPAQALRERRDIGAPFGLAAINEHSIAYTDFRTNSVRLVDVRTSTLRLLAGNPLADGSGRGSGNTDGSREVARFHAPFGIVIGPGGELAIADGGSRRVRLLRGVEAVEPLLESDVAGAAPQTRGVIAYAGDASIWQGTEWADSIQGRLQTMLNARPCAGCSSLRVVPVILRSFGSGLTALGAMPRGRFDTVVLQLNAHDAAGLVEGDAHRPASAMVWRPALTAALRRLAAELKNRGARLVVLIQPSPEDIAPTAGFWGRAASVSFAGTASADQLRDAASAAGVTLADATPDFKRTQATAPPPALFASADAELAAGGREALASVAARAVAAARAGQRG